MGNLSGHSLEKIERGLTLLKDCRDLNCHIPICTSVYKQFELDVLTRKRHLKETWIHRANQICPGVSKTTAITEMIEELLR